jgi:hypothetical protein
MSDRRASARDEVDPSVLSGPGHNGLGREHPIGHKQVSDIQRARILASMMDIVAERGAGSATVAHVVAR